MRYRALPQVAETLGVHYAPLYRWTDKSASMRGFIEAKLLFDAVEMGFDQFEGAGVVSEALPGRRQGLSIRDERRVIPRAG